MALTRSITWLRKIKKVKVPISFSRERRNPRNRNWMRSLFRQNQMLETSTAIFSSRPTAAIPTEPYPRRRSGRVKKGSSSFWAMVSSRWKTNLSWAAALQRNTMLGKVRVMPAVIRTMRTPAVRYSPSVRPPPRIPRRLRVITPPQRAQSRDTPRKTVRNIPLSRAVSSGSFSSLALE